MWSGRAWRMCSSPPATATAATYVAAWMRSGTVRWSTGCSEPGSTPRTTSVAVPMPEMSAPIATNISQRSTTSGSLAALSIVVTPSANTAAVTMFSVAPTLGNPKRDLGAVQAVGGRLQLAVAELELGTHRLQPGDVHVDRPGAEVVAAGHRQAHPTAAREQRAEHVDRGPDALDQLVRGDGREVAGVGHPQPAGLGDLGADADGRPAARP